MSPSLRVLIVDDARLARSELRTLLAAIPWVECVGEADDVPAARDAILREQPDLVLLDVQMPSGEGFDVLDGLETVPMVVFVTAYDQYAVRAFDTNALDYLVKPVAHYKHRLLMMLDEFPSLGKLEIMQESLAFVAGYGIKCYLICQDINQLKSRETGYGHDESITSNCHVQNAYPPNRVETAEHLSRLTGQTTVVKEQITTSGRRTAAMLGQVSRTYQEVQRPLLTPDECLRMPGPKKNAQGEIEEAGDMVIYVAGYPAIYGKQPLYFKDPVFSARAAIPAPKVSDRLRAVAQAETEGEGITI